MTCYRPFMTGAGRLAMGVKSLDPADWIEIGEDFDAQMSERRRLLDRRPEEVLASLPGSEPGQQELSALLLEHLASHAQSYYEIDADIIHCLRSGLRLAKLDQEASPLLLIGRLVQEDFCLLQQRGSAYHLVAAVLCFPAHWRLADKLGRPLLDIHAPVPAFAEELGNPVDRLFDRLQVERPVQRLNWSLVDTTELYLPPAHRTKAVDITAENAGDRLWLRVERQTLRRLPASGDIVFGIRTHLAPLCEAVDTSEAANAMIQRLKDMPATMAAYKNLTRIREPLFSYLERQRA